MANLYLVRHAQASFFKSDYDNLSVLGYEQAERLGAFFKGQQLDAVVHGTLNRHKQTLEGIQRALNFSEVINVSECFNEIDHVDIIRRYQALNHDKNDERSIGDDVENNPPKNALKAFQTMFEKALHYWVTSDSVEFNETWQQFRKRVLEGLHRHLVQWREANKKNILVITSGGPIAVMVQSIIESPMEKTFELNHQLANTSITHCKFNEEKISLASFNQYCHLKTDANIDHASELITFR